MRSRKTPNGPTTWRLETNAGTYRDPLIIAATDRLVCEDVDGVVISDKSLIYYVKYCNLAYEPIPSTHTTAWYSNHKYYKVNVPVVDAARAFERSNGYANMTFATYLQTMFGKRK